MKFKKFSKHTSKAFVDIGNTRGEGSAPLHVTTTHGVRPRYGGCGGGLREFEYKR